MSESHAMPPSPEARVSPIQIMAPRSPAVLSPMQRRMAPTKSLQHLKRTPEKDTAAARTPLQQNALQTTARTGRVSDETDTKRNKKKNGKNGENLENGWKTLGKHSVLSLGLLSPARSLLLPPLCLL